MTTAIVFYLIPSVGSAPSPARKPEKGQKEATLIPPKIFLSHLQRGDFFVP